MSISSAFTSFASSRFVSGDLADMFLLVGRVERAELLVRFLPVFREVLAFAMFALDFGFYARR